MSSGRKCDGYDHGQTSVTSRAVITIYLPPIQKQLIPSLGSHELEFYRQKIATKLSGDFDSDFWSVLVLQLSQSEPAIRHAVSAISVIYKDIETAISPSSTGYVPPSHLAVQESTAAMRYLWTRLKAEPSSNLIPLVACVLFTCVEFLRGSVDSALVHMRSGFKIINASRASCFSSEGQLQIQYSENTAIEKHVLPVFSRLNLLCILFGHILLPVQSTLGKNQLPFTNLTEARIRLFEVMDPAICFIRSAAPMAHMFQLTLEEYIHKTKLENELEQWQNDFEDLISQHTRSKQPLNQDAVDLLRMHYRAVSIWLSTCTSVEECAVDCHISGFQEIVDLGKKLTTGSNHQHTHFQPENFSFDMQTIAPLYYTAIECRSPSIRRSALNLLRLATRREGLWNAHIATKVAERIIEIEEKNLPTIGKSYPGVDHFHEEVMPAETDRISFIQELPGEFRDMHEYTTPEASMPGQTQVIFRTKPWDLTGEWYEIREFVNL
jgi:hypothetical protein